MAILLLKSLLSLIVMVMPCLVSSTELDQSPLPSNFLFGTSSSAYQYEGAYLSDGKGPNIFDVFLHQSPGTTVDRSNGDIAVDQYHRYLGDIDLMEAMKVNSYRFSISWARVLPKGRFGEINRPGVNYYNKLIDALLVKGIQPFVTLFHFDTPQELEDRNGAWLSPQSREDFQYFAELCFKSFGDRVKYWATFNEPEFLATYGYRLGEGPPGRCSKPFGNCRQGDSEREPFLVVHNIILSHADAVDIYRTKYQAKQGGRIGIAVHADWYEPISNSTEDKLATERARSFNSKWILDPIIFGKYPKEMQEILGSILPRFSSNDQEKLKKGVDFIGINHYMSFYVKDCVFSVCEQGLGITRTEGSYQTSPNGKLASLDLQYVNPKGMEKIVTYIKDRYNNIPMFLTENGYGQMSHSNFTKDQYLKDFNRIDYMEGHLDSLLEAIRKGANVKGYFAWSLLDNFEWIQGYTVRYGLYHVDRATLERTPKLSANWYKDFIAKHRTETFFRNYGGRKLVEII